MEFTQILNKIRETALATSNKYDEDSEGPQSPFMNSVDSYKWWKRIKPADFDSKFGVHSFTSTYNNITVNTCLGAPVRVIRVLCVS